jgi:hypothetical protein
MATLDDLRLNAGYRLPDPVHPDSLVDAVNEVAARYPMAVTAEGLKDNIVARVAVELGCSWYELGLVEDLVTELNEYYTLGAPLCFQSLALQYWSLLDDLSAQGWTWSTIAGAIDNLHRNHNTLEPPF